MSPQRSGKWMRSAALLLLLTLLAVSQASANKPPTWQYGPVGGGENGGDWPPGDGGPTDGGDPDEVYNCIAPQQPVIVPIDGSGNVHGPNRWPVVERTWPSFWMRILFWSGFSR